MVETLEITALCIECGGFRRTNGGCQLARDDVPIHGAKGAAQSS